MAFKNGARVGATAFVLGLWLVGPEAVGVAAADSGDSDPAAVSGTAAESAAGTARPHRSAAGRQTATAYYSDDDTGFRLAGLAEFSTD